VIEKLCASTARYRRLNCFCTPPFTVIGGNMGKDYWRMTRIERELKLIKRRKKKLEKEVKPLRKKYKGYVE